jgi:hypothetical protein
MNSSAVTPVRRVFLIALIPPFAIPLKLELDLVKLRFKFIGLPEL